MKGETEVYFPPARDEGSERFEVELEGEATYRWDETIEGLLRIEADAKKDEHWLRIRPKI